MKRKLCFLFVYVLVTVSAFGCTWLKDREQSQSGLSTEEKWIEAKNTPFGSYPETVTYTLAKEISGNNSNMPAGDNYEDNAYTRYLLEKLNIQNVNVFEAMGNEYNTEVSMSIAMSDVPDIMVVNSYGDVAMMHNMGLLADLTENYEYCASDTIKEIYESYGKELLDSVTFDGKIMAIPETNIAEGPNLIWLRKDWMTELNLEEPKTLEDVEYIVSRFIEEDSNRVGIVTTSSLCGESGYSSQYLMDTVFACYGAFPKQWLESENGVVKYGSVQPEAKEALAHLNEMYTAGILDRDFLFRSSNDIIELIESGKCGAFFGPWWSPNNPLLNMRYTDDSAEWHPYLISTDDGGVTSYHSTNPTSYKYVVVSKNCEHPELAWKIISVLFDYARFQDEDGATEIAEYDKNAVDPTARPLVINVDYKNALEICYSNIKQALNGEKELEELSELERSYAEQCIEYLNNEGTHNAQQWAAYESRIIACSLIAQDNVKEVKALFFESTSTMDSCWWKLKELENNAYLRIVTGQVDIDYFDTFVQEWNNQGGLTITREVKDYFSRKVSD